MPPVSSLPRMSGRVLALAVTLAVFAAVPTAHAATPRVHAIVHARIVTAPGQRIDNGTLVIRDGIITAVGANVSVPADARVWDAESLTVYPGLIDAFVVPADAAPGFPGAAPGAPGTRPGRPAAESEPSRGAASPQPAVRAEYRVIENVALPRAQLDSLRAAGFTVAQVAPRRGIVRGTSAVLGLGDGPANSNAIIADAAQVVALEPWAQGYPGSLMGAIAVLRQAFIDAKWYRDANAAYAKSPTAGPRPPVDDALAALQPAIENHQPVQFIAGDMLGVLRAAAIAREAGVTARAVGAGDEYKRVREVAATGLTLIEPVAFPATPDVGDDDSALEVSTEELRAWRDAPGNPAALANAGVVFALTTSGLKGTSQFAPNVGKAVARGWSADAALASVTTVPARLLGLDSQLGTIAPGRVANLTVTRGTLFAGGRVREVWVDGNRYETARDEPSPAGKWKIRWGQGEHALAIVAAAETTVTLVVGADTLKARNGHVDTRRVRFLFQARAGEPVQNFDLRAANDALSGTVTVANTAAQPVTGIRVWPESRPAKPEDRVPSPVVAGDPEAWRARPPAQPAAVLVRNATVWTAGPQGTMTGADLLLAGGKVVAVGRGLAAPKGAVVIDGTGKHVAPGIIDEHSHAAILGNVNECTNSVTCEVRIQDVINSESQNIYRQLAGGVTAMHLLHGSCNAIGGQCAVIRSRWGAPPDQLYMSDAPPTVKFALGENPKQANFGADRTDRYPKTRAGVEQTIREAFLEAQDYDRAFAEYRAGTRPIPPRRDLQLEALSEILHGTRLVHCHSYRQDEILMLMRLAESFGFRINTFTHILEGYKVADEMAEHGASGIGFSDWWQYKQEVIDAIPQNAWLMWDRGVNVGFNSDDGELARRLNTEAAKAIKYGGMPPEEAIKTVTLNPAKSLKIDGRMGSLEPGKDADFAIWSGSPLSPYSRCEQTWIEGRCYFDRAADMAGREALARERTALIAGVRAAKRDAPGGGMERRGPPPRYLEETDQGGNECGEHTGHKAPFASDVIRRAREAGEGGSR